jgi:phosphoribosyl 1,2-cyclic phosphodiesterase
MLDCGFGLRDSIRRLEQRNIDPESLNAILVTHEHTDHCGGVARLARRHKIPVYASYGTHAAMRAMHAVEEQDDYPARVVCNHTQFEVGALRVTPFPVPHDAREPTQFIFEHDNKRLGVLTDVGVSTPCIRAHLDGCDALVLECNHDESLLANSDYPERLKRRIAGPYGHLSNSHSAQLLASLDRSRLKVMHAAHLSRQNNSPELVRKALESVPGIASISVLMSTQEDGFEWQSI